MLHLKRFDMLDAKSTPPLSADCIQRIPKSHNESITHPPCSLPGSILGFSKCVFWPKQHSVSSARFLSLRNNLTMLGISLLKLNTSDLI